MSVLSGSAILPTVAGAPSGRDRKALMSMADTSSRGRMIPTFSRCARACTAHYLSTCMCQQRCTPDLTSYITCLGERMHVPLPFSVVCCSVQQHIKPEMTAGETYMLCTSHHLNKACLVSPAQHDRMNNHPADQQTQARKTF